MDDLPERAKSRNLNQLRPALRFLAPYRREVILASIALVVTASVTLSIGQGMRVVIDEGFGAGSSDILVESIGLFALLVGLLIAGTFVRFYYVSWVGERVSADIRRALFDHLIRLHPGFFESNQPTEIQSRITTDTTLLQNVIGSSVSIALRNMLMFIGGLALLIVTNLKLSMIVVGSVPFVVVPVLWFGRRVRSLSRSSQDRLADVGSFAGESLRHIKIVQAFNHERDDAERFAGRVELAFDVAAERVRQRALLIALVMALVLGAIATMLWVGGQDVLAGRTTAGELAAFIFYAFIVAGSVGAISEVYTDLQRAAGAMERVVELLYSDNELPEPAEPQVLAGSGPAALSARSLSFVYAGRPDVPVLQGLEFDVAPGEMVAIVGPSGAGKSTLFDLLQRFYDPTSGQILLNGLDLRSLRLADVRGVMGFVPQDPVLFAGTVLENLRYGAPDASLAEVQAALTQAGAADLVAGFPEGLETRIGESGAGLSGGQRQRLAIARALLPGPRVLLLDEATSALDAQSEAHIRSTVEALHGRCTILVIAHRLSTVRQADRILVLDGGRIQASGTHDQLLAGNPLYARFARLQFSAESLSDPTVLNSSNWTTGVGGAS